MKEKPILFSALMVLAILEGRKTQTRRIVKPQPNGETAGLVLPESTQYEKDKLKVRFIDYELAKTNIDKAIQYITSPYKKDDILWVRETFAELDEFENGYKREPNILFGYRADLSAKNSYDDKYLDTTGWNWEHKDIKWKPSIFMPKDACRIKLLVKKVRIERLQDISEEDCIAEGVEEKNGMYRDYSDKNPNAFRLSPYISYLELWVGINSVKSWDEDPFVWVIEFERIK